MTKGERQACVVLLLPSVLMALALACQEAWRLIAPASSWFARPVSATFATALARDDVQTAFGFVKTGIDANAPITVRDQVLTKDRLLPVTPLAWAVAHGSDRSVRMLIAFGADIDPPGPMTYACLASHLGHTEVSRILASLDTSQQRPCPGSPLDSFPLEPFSPR